MAAPTATTIFNYNASFGVKIEGMGVLPKFQNNDQIHVPMPRNTEFRPCFINNEPVRTDISITIDDRYKVGRIRVAANNSYTFSESKEYEHFVYPGGMVRVNVEFFPELESLCTPKTEPEIMNYDMNKSAAIVFYLVEPQPYHPTHYLNPRQVSETYYLQKKIKLENDQLKRDKEFKDAVNDVLTNPDVWTVPQKWFPVNTHPHDEGSQAIYYTNVSRFVIDDAICLARNNGWRVNDSMGAGSGSLIISFPSKPYMPLNDSAAEALRLRAATSTGRTGDE